MLSDLEVSRACVGMDTAPIALTLALKAESPGLMVEDGDGVMLRARMIKLPEELQALEEATSYHRRSDCRGHCSCKRWGAGM